MFKITALDHVGIRVLDRERSLAFYSKLGFRVDPHEDAPDYRAVGLVNDAGVRIHLIYNGLPFAEGKNPLMDQPIKWPGYTHGAVIVDSMDELVLWLAKQEITITEGPSIVGDGRRRLCFIRDPDQNVIEFNEILDSSDQKS
jgi:catechol 2,3-dioxygenase-like lactoylglutathione lyase family enzyme